MTWRYHTPERDGHAPDDWVEKQPVEYLSGGVCWLRAASPQWNAETKYRYRPLQPVEPSFDTLKDQCLALPQDQREALIEAMKKPQRDWADDAVLEGLRAAGLGSHVSEFFVGKVAAAIRSMCRPKEGDDLIQALKIAFWASIQNANGDHKYLDYDSLDEIISAAWVGFEDAALTSIRVRQS